MTLRHATIIKFALIGLVVGLVVAGTTSTRESLGYILSGIISTTIILGLFGVFMSRRLPADAVVPPARARVLKLALAVLAVLLIGVTIMLAKAGNRSADRAAGAPTASDIQNLMEKNNKRFRTMEGASDASRNGN
ncbi:hypothetical protein [Sphingomonas sp.]|uniref:hypothetical protein n=1 Tax=Sphingomonas sp. TaxID=28214 RepID=UPI003D6C8C3E